MARSFNDFRNRRSRATVTHELRPLLLPAHEDVDGRGRGFAIIAVALLVLGMILRAVGLMRVQQAIHTTKFEDMRSPDVIVQSLNQVTSSLGAATDWLVFAGALTFVGFAFAWTTVVKRRYRAPWSLPVFVTMAVLHLPLVPIGTLLGITSLWYFILHRREFSAPRPVLPVSP